MTGHFQDKSSFFFNFMLFCAMFLLPGLTLPCVKTFSNTTTNNEMSDTTFSRENLSKGFTNQAASGELHPVSVPRQHKKMAHEPSWLCLTLAQCGVGACDCLDLCCCSRPLVKEHSWQVPMCLSIVRLRFTVYGLKVWKQLRPNSRWFPLPQLFTNFYLLSAEGLCTCCSQQSVTRHSQHSVTGHSQQRVDLCDQEGNLA